MLCVLSNIYTSTHALSPRSFLCQKPSDAPHRCTWTIPPHPSELSLSTGSSRKPWVTSVLEAQEKQRRRRSSTSSSRDAGRTRDSIVREPQVMVAARGWLFSARLTQWRKGHLNSLRMRMFSRKGINYYRAPEMGGSCKDRQEGLEVKRRGK